MHQRSSTSTSQGSGHGGAWELVQTDFTGSALKSHEGLFTQGSGALHVRGSLEEPLDGAPQNQKYWRMPGNVTAEKFREERSKWGTYVPGVYGPHPLLNNEIINLPWFLWLHVHIDEEPLDIDACAIADHRRRLDLRTNTLERTLTWNTTSGKAVSLRFERFVDLVSQRVCLQRVHVESDKPCAVRVRSGIDSTNTTNGYDHVQEVQLDWDDRTLTCDVHTDGGDRVSIASELVLANAGDSLDLSSIVSERSVWQDITADLTPGACFTLEKRSAVTTSRDEDRFPADPQQLLTALAERPYEGLHHAHASAWSERWDAADVRVTGNDRAQLCLRAALAHLLRAHPTNDARVAIDAKGYAGEAYWGRFFWDTEMYLLPFFLYTDPKRAKTLVDFRTHTLDGARDNAKALGLPGAKYAWESDLYGVECCPNWQYADHEVHISADVVFGLAHHSAATGQRTALDDPAADVAFETARYWRERVVHRAGTDQYELLKVMGPDEYSPMENNNAYTNAIVSFALRTAADQAEQRDLHHDEVGVWRAIADSLPIPRTGSGLILQSDGFDQLPIADFEGRWHDRSRPFPEQVPQEYLYRTQCLKQADVLMLMWLFPEMFTDDEVRTAWDYYLPRTTHHSSLSAAIHSIIACRLGFRDDAWSLWERACAIDLDGGAAEGIHIAACGGVWLMAVQGFAGMRTALDTDTLTLEPSLPEGWSALAFPIVWQRKPAYITVEQGTVRIENRSNEPLDASVAGQRSTIAPGDTGVFDTDTKAR